MKFNKIFVHSVAVGGLRLVHLLNTSLNLLLQNAHGDPVLEVTLPDSSLAYLFATITSPGLPSIPEFPGCVNS